MVRAWDRASRVPLGEFRSTFPKYASASAGSMPHSGWPNQVSHETQRSLEKDGWRCSVHTGSGRIWSRHGKLLPRAFADVAEVARELPDCLLDGELLAVTDAGEISFGRLQTRAGRGPKPGADFTAHLAAFDVLAIGERTDLRPRPYRERRGQLLELLDGGPPQIRPVPVTTDLGEAMGWVDTYRAGWSPDGQHHTCGAGPFSGRHGGTCSGSSICSLTPSMM
ncbi:hypothetical protein ACFYWU_42310 [Streptomyces chrestomyceticus]|uniref:ATP-dependent DNA ligase n=1 Tax=Streptomyces chrestomyceticus TaxID=68185 RepID=UPI003693C92F